MKYCKCMHRHTRLIMNQYSFNIKGHPNTKATHKNTLEFTKDRDLSLKGDCIVGVDSDFELEKLIPFLAKNKLILQIVHDNIILDEIIFIPNKSFCDGHEIVIRKSDFISDRTFGVRCDKAAIDLNPKIVSLLKNKSILQVIINEYLM